ncbi:MAG TPA: DUF4307 domain-containing protein [Frankiaceae bacterium]|nr:DUF4307 domain-containing protein [Frankiaceae bacterium]
MAEQNGGEPTPSGSSGRTPAIPVARRPDDRSARGASERAGQPGRKRRLSWDIPWLGGRSTAPWVVLATVLILAIATAGALYAKQRPDRLGWTTKTVVVSSNSTVDFTFSVYKAPAATAACDIVAADQDGGVGTLRDVPIPARADGNENTTLTVAVPTTRRADTAVLQTCRIVRSG